MIRLGVEFKDGQGLGNQLWCYASVRSIAEYLGLEFKTFGFDRFKGKSFLDIEKESSAGGNYREESVEWRVRKEKLYYDKDLDYIGSGYDESLLNINCDTIIEGLLQDERYLALASTSIEGMIRVANENLERVDASGEYCVINIRGGEYKRHKRFLLPKSYWISAINHMRSKFGVDKFIIVTDDAAYSRDLLPGHPIVSGDICECYMTIRAARYCIVSNSTFSYFPIKTGNNARFVIAPKYWARYNNSRRRWASVANFYQDWTYQDKDGSLSSHADCVEEIKALEEEYTRYNISVCSVIERSNRYKQFAPSFLKEAVKNMLRLIDPVSH